MSTEYKAKFEQQLQGWRRSMDQVESFLATDNAIDACVRLKSVLAEVVAVEQSSPSMSIQTQAQEFASLVRSRLVSAQAQREEWEKRILDRKASWEEAEVIAYKSALPQQ